MKNFGKYFMKKINIVFVFLLFLSFVTVCFSHKASAAEEQIRDTDMYPFRILCISSYNYAYPTVPDQINGLADGLGALSVDIDYEFMDAKNYYKAADFSAFHDYLAYKINQSEPFDLIVLCDDTALHFGINYRDELFPDVPIIFTGVNNQEDAKAAAARENVTGITQALDFDTNLTLAKKLFPRRTHIILIVDNTSTAQGEFTEFQKYAQKLEGADKLDVSVINSSNYSKGGLQRAISEINRSDSLILYLSCLEDGEGHIYTLKTGTALIVNNAPDVPIWRMTLSDMGNGVFGGISYSYYGAGVRAGQMASEILTGTSPDDIPLESNAATHAYFDQEQLDEFGILSGQLPDGATIINEHQTLFSFYKQNALLMNLIMLVILLMIIIIVILVIVNGQRAILIRQDFLTQMPNRPYITSRLASVIDSGEPFGVIMMDVDHFKNINDTLGHLIGDELLTEVAKRLKSFPEKDVIFARIGGDEFMGLIFNADRQKAERLCTELVEIMKTDFELSTGDIHITISAGAAVFPQDTDKPQLLQNYADAALYEVKKNGRNGYRLYSTACSSPSSSSV